ncbi:transglycosylase domain-containing protein [Nocardia sp. NPDC046473]|uniref:transglycosylase domain-containing protein n=1 Tax=Nocardia sp. NPDC046473 TaxID=3155733 RepID=UPI00340413CC
MVLLLTILVPTVTFAISYTVIPVPSPNELKSPQVATILAADGSVLSKIIPPAGNRTDVTLAQIPIHVRDAVIAAEDPLFYTDPGFSLSGLAGGLRDKLFGGDSSGRGLTITQQFVRNVLTGNEPSLSNRMRELVTTAKIARQWSKDDLLTAYLNVSYFGRGAFGIDAAAAAYFDKPVTELSVAQGAVLAAVLDRPFDLDPDRNPEGAKLRWNSVLDRMVENGRLAAASRSKTQFPPVIPAESAQQQTMQEGPEGLIENQVRNELLAAGISEQQLDTAGLKITTTIDPIAQQAAVAAVAKNTGGEPESRRTAVVSVDPRTGAVRAYVGGSDGRGYDFANVSQQPGSSFYPFGLAANLDLGKPLSTTYDSGPLDVHGIKIVNDEGEQCGICPIDEALKRSLRTSFFRMELDMGNDGAQRVAAMAHKLGIPETVPGVGKSLTEPDGSGPNLGVVAGQYAVRPLDMASAYATLAASGVYHASHFVQKVVTADGQVLLDRGAVSGEQRVDAAVADNVTAAMRPIASWSRAHDLAGARVSAAKTGTVELGDTGENKDAWMVGYTPSLATVVWVGTAQGERLRNANGAMIYGSGLPADIWKDTMDGALNGTPNENFPIPR